MVRASLMTLVLAFYSSLGHATAVVYGDPERRGATLCEESLMDVQSLDPLRYLHDHFMPTLNVHTNSRRALARIGLGNFDAKELRQLHLLVTKFEDVISARMISPSGKTIAELKFPEQGPTLWNRSGFGRAFAPIGYVTVPDADGVRLFLSQIRPNDRSYVKLGVDVPCALTKQFTSARPETLHLVQAGDVSLCRVTALEFAWPAVNLDPADAGRWL